MRATQSEKMCKCLAVIVVVLTATQISSTRATDSPKEELQSCICSNSTCQIVRKTPSATYSNAANMRWEYVKCSEVNSSQTMCCSDYDDFRQKSAGNYTNCKLAFDANNNTELSACELVNGSCVHTSNASLQCVEITRNGTNKICLEECPCGYETKGNSCTVVTQTGSTATSVITTEETATNGSTTAPKGITERPSCQPLAFDIYHYNEKLKKCEGFNTNFWLLVTLTTGPLLLIILAVTICVSYRRGCCCCRRTSDDNDDPEGPPPAKEELAKPSEISRGKSIPNDYVRQTPEQSRRPHIDSVGDDYATATFSRQGNNGEETVNMNIGFHDTMQEDYENIGHTHGHDGEVTYDNYEAIKEHLAGEERESQEVYLDMTSGQSTVDDVQEDYEEPQAVNTKTPTRPSPVKAAKVKKPSTGATLVTSPIIAPKPTHYRRQDSQPEQAPMLAAAYANSPVFQQLKGIAQNRRTPEQAPEVAEHPDSQLEYYEYTGISPVIREPSAGTQQYDDMPSIQTVYEAPDSVEEVLYENVGHNI